MSVGTKTVKLAARRCKDKKNEAVHKCQSWWPGNWHIIQGGLRIDAHMYDTENALSSSTKILKMNSVHVSIRDFQLCTHFLAIYAFRTKYLRILSPFIYDGDNIRKYMQVRNWSLTLFIMGSFVDVESQRSSTPSTLRSCCHNVTNVFVISLINYYYHYIDIFFWELASRPSFPYNS